MELAFSVQKQKLAIIDCIRNCIKKEKKTLIREIIIIKNEGIHKLCGLNIKKNIAINNAKGNLVICSAICWAKYLMKGCKGWIKYGDTLPKRASSSNVNTIQTTENCLTKNALKKYLESIILLM